MAEPGKKKHIAGKEWLGWALKTFKDLRFRKQLYVFFICLLISVFIWLSIKLSKEYNTSVKHPVEYTSYPQDKILTNNPPGKIYLKVKGRGTELIEARFREPNQPLQINLSNVDMRQVSKHQFHSQVPAVWFLSQIARQSKYYDKLIDIDPDTLEFRFEDLKYRQVPVKPNLIYKLEDQVWLRKPTSVEPDSVVISGTVSAVDTVKAVYTKKINLGKISQEVTKPVKLKDFSTKFLSMEKDSVVVKVSAEKYTESQVIVPILAETPPDVDLKTFPDKVTITFRVSLEDYDRVNSSMFRAVVSYSPENGQFLPVEVDRAPGFVRIAEISPEEVEYILLQ